MKPLHVDTAGAAYILGFVNAKTGEPDRARTWKYLEAKRCPCKRRGRTYLYRPEDVERTLQIVRT